MRGLFAKFISNQNGATAIEYGLIAALIAVVIITALTSIGTYATGLQPVAMGIDPSTNHFLYTANYLGDTVSGFELSTSAGTLLVSQYSPYSTNAEPVALAAVPHNGTGSGAQK